MSDLRRDLTAKSRRCGRCNRPFPWGSASYVPGRYDAWSWPKLPVCGGCADELALEDMKERGDDNGGQVP